MIKVVPDYPEGVTLLEDERGRFLCTREDPVVVDLDVPAKASAPLYPQAQNSVFSRHLINSSSKELS